MRGRYPLEVLHRVRERRVDEAAADLEKRTSDMGRQRLKLEQIAAELASHKAAEQAVVHNEHLRGERETLQAADLQQLVAFQVSARRERDRLENELRKAKEQLANALTQQAEARQRLAAVKADERVVGQHRERFERELVREADRQEEEACAEHGAHANRGKA